jgi:hypothetical protein
MAGFQTLLADGAGRLARGAEAQVPMVNGDLVELIGAFADGSSAGGMLAVVISDGIELHTFKVRVLYADDEYFRWHLMENPETTQPVIVKFAAKTIDLTTRQLKGKDVEMISSWRVLPVPSDCTWLPEDMMPRIRSDVNFIREMLSSEHPPHPVE